MANLNVNHGALYLVEDGRISQIFKQIQLLPFVKCPYCIVLPFQLHMKLLGPNPSSPAKQFHEQMLGTRMLGVQIVSFLTLFLSLSKASLRLNILRRSRMFAARRCDIVGTRRRFFDDRLLLEIENRFKIWVVAQCDQIGRFFYFLVTNFRTKVAQIFWYLFGQF